MIYLNYMKIFLVLLIGGLLWASPAHAAIFYEFNPDYSQSLLVASSETVSEVFLPLNDYLGSLDFWVSNANTAGNATFTLYNSVGTAIAERIVSVPAIADTADGTRFHVALPAQLAVTGNTPYRVRIATANPKFRLYYADATQLLAHNGSPLPAYTGGLARIGNNDMGFSFKFALYENQESAPPQLTGVTVTQQSSAQTNITFNANEPVDRRLQYGGITVDYNGEYSSCAPGIQVCSLTLAVSPATTYQYTLTVKDVWGNQSTATGNFTTLNAGQTPTPTPTASASTSPTPTATSSPTPDTTAPAIINARLVTSTPHTASFAWTTNEAANGIVVVQTLPYLIGAGTNNDNTLELEHFINVGNLSPDTYFRATITSSDAVGNSAQATVDFLTPSETMPTPSASPGTTPPPTASPTPTPSGGTIEVTGPPDNPQITWSPPAGGDPETGYRIDIFDSENKLIKTVIVPPGQNQVALGTLPEGNNRVVVYANNNEVFEKVAAPTSLNVSSRSFLERAVGALPYMLGGIVVIIFTVVMVMKLRKPKPPVVSSPSGPADKKTGAKPNPSPF